MKYGIICAMDEEIKLLQEDLTDAAVTEVAGRAFCSGRLYGKDVVLVKSRIGKVASASTATTLIDRFAPDCVIFCGSAGGVNKDLNVGDIVIGDRLIQHDFDCGDPSRLMQVPVIGVKYFETDAALSAALEKAVNAYTANGMKDDIPQEYLDEFGIVAPKTQTGTVASGDQFICDNAKNAWLEANIENLQCAEMEGAAVAQVCYEFGVPFGVVRVISDSANSDSNVDFERFIGAAACHFTRGSIRAFLKAEA